MYSGTMNAVFLLIENPMCNAKTNRSPSLTSMFFPHATGSFVSASPRTKNAITWMLCGPILPRECSKSRSLQQTWTFPNTPQWPNVSTSTRRRPCQRFWCFVEALCTENGRWKTLKASNNGWCKDGNRKRLKLFHLKITSLRLMWARLWTG